MYLNTAEALLWPVLIECMKLFYIPRKHLPLYEYVMETCKISLINNNFHLDVINIFNV